MNPNVSLVIEVVAANGVAIEDGVVTVVGACCPKGTPG